MRTIDLNCDLGESFGAWTMGADRLVVPLITSANVACGFHASDPGTMRDTVALCAAHGVRIGAHPGFPDLVGFGRRNLAASEREVADMVTYQLGALAAFCRAAGVPLTHVKPHGALYNMAAKDARLADAICRSIAAFDEKLILLALSGSEMLASAERLGLRGASEVFADRAYQSDGTLVPRAHPGSMIEDEDESVARVVRMAAEGVVASIDGRDIAIRADSVCVHGDGPNALAFVRRIREELAAQGVRVAPFGA